MIGGKTLDAQITDGKAKVEGDATILSHVWGDRALRAGVAGGLDHPKHGLGNLSEPDLGLTRRDLESVQCTPT